MSDDGASAPMLVNPFSPVGVAKAAESPSSSAHTVETAAVRRAWQRLVAYITAVRRGEPTTESGNVVAIAGDYGSGKTHLAMLLRNLAGGENLERLKQQLPADISCVYLEAAPSFKELYLNFAGQLVNDDVQARVREYYANVVSRRLGDTELSSRAESLLRDGKVNPVDVTSTLGLSESSLLEDLRRRLAAVTDNVMFASALSLLSRPGFEEPVWEWLRGAAPKDVLTERGITQAIDTDQLALEAFGVFALLYRHQRRPFVLILDEMTKVLPHDRPSSEQSVDTLRRLFDVFSGANALLVLAGLPESFELLTTPVQQRIGEIITVDPFGPTEVRDLVTGQLATIRRPGDQRDLLWPFSEAALTEIAQLTGGNPRKVVTTCHALFQAAVINRALEPPVTAAHVMSELTPAVPPDRLLAKLKGVVRNIGWPVNPEYCVSAAPETTVDLWIPVGTEAGCGVIVGDAVTDETAVRRLAARAEAIRAAEGVRTELLLVIGAPIGEEHTKRLQAAFGRRPLVYREPTFFDTVATELKGMRHRLEGAAGGATDPILHDQVARLTDQQDRMQDTMEELAGGVRALQVSAEQAFGVIRRELDEAVRLAASFADRQGAEPRMTALPRRVRQIFDECTSGLSDLTAFGTVPPLWDGLFAVPLEWAQRRQRLARLQAVLHPHNDPLLRALGVAVTLRSAADAFRRAVNDWFRNSAPGEGRRLPIREREEFESLCQAYDNALTYVSIDSLEGFGSVADAGQRQQVDDLVTSTSRQFESLGVDVRHAVLSAFPV